ncbi:tetratricopeptide repeat protein [Actinoplanes sp. KI2]|uniref:tetratricopeptide repeat protein n=1 Tax=Actinoplanes sp. KI2 TaxID=2983315 RepID=UPI0021D5AEC2|nr:tetratricopeptide repeat protein [Actinoplanes sp. KI2]MCU7728624.1 tetratricopeptide repeat protein [Actinoplanes sp. KI2]
MTADDAYRRAQRLAEAGRYEEAERATREGLAGAPGDARLLTLLAWVLRLRRDYAAALAAGDHAVAAAPHLADAHAERAESLIVLLRSAEAVAAAEEAVRLAPVDASAHLVLARALTAARAHDRARAAAAHGLALDPRSVDGLLTVADVERQAGRRDAALAATHAALAIDPANSYGRWLIAVLDAERLRVRRSMRGLRDVARDNPAAPDLIAMTWPIRGVLSGLRRGLAVGATLVCVLLIAGHWWPQAGGFARIVSAVLAAVLTGFAARVLLPAGRLPWRCLPLLPALMRRAAVAGLVTVAVAVALLVVHVATGWAVAAVLALALAPVLWAYSMIEALGAGLDDPGARQALLGVFDEFRDWWTTTKRDLRDAWK